MKVSIVIPYHDTPDTARFLERLLCSIRIQTHKGYEIVLMKEGRMGETYNACIKKSEGDIIKMMGMDDYFAHPNSLKEIVEAFEAYPDSWWVAAACMHDDEKKGEVWGQHIPKWNEKLWYGWNTVGGFATISLRNKDVPLINEELDWVVDCDWYWRIWQQHGLPRIIENTNVIIGVHEGQTTNKLSDEQKVKEYQLMHQRYGN